MRLKYFYLPIIVGLVNEELLSTGRRGEAHCARLGVVAGMVAVVLPGQPGLVPDNTIVQNSTHSSQEKAGLYLSGWNLLTKQSMEMLTVSGLQ